MHNKLPSGLIFLYPGKDNGGEERIFINDINDVIQDADWDGWNWDARAKVLAKKCIRAFVWAKWINDYQITETHYFLLHLLFSYTTAVITAP